MEITGKLYKKLDTQQVTDRFRKRELVLELTDNPRYPQHVLFQLTGDRCEQLDDFQVGDPVRLEFSLRGREWTSPKGDVKYFNSLDVWTLARVGTGAEGSDHPQGDDEPPPLSDDDMPF